MLPSEVPRLATDSPVRIFPGVWKLLSFLRPPSRDGYPSLPLLSLFLSFIFFPTSFRRQWAAFLECLMSSASIQKLFCGICLAFKCSFDEFLGEKVVSPSYSSTILGSPPLSFSCKSCFCFYSDSQFTNWFSWGNIIYTYIKKLTKLHAKCEIFPESLIYMSHFRLRLWHLHPISYTHFSRFLFCWHLTCSSCWSNWSSFLDHL